MSNEPAFSFGQLDPIVNFTCNKCGVDYNNRMIHDCEVTQLDLKALLARIEKLEARVRLLEASRWYGMMPTGPVVDVKTSGTTGGGE